MRTVTAGTIFVLGAICGPFLGEVGKDGWRVAKDFVRPYVSHLNGKTAGTVQPTNTFYPTAYAIYLSTPKSGRFPNEAGWIDVAYSRTSEPSYDFQPLVPSKKRKGALTGGYFGVGGGFGEPASCSSNRAFNDSCWSPGDRS